MDDAPFGWAEALARSESELERGEVVPASEPHEEMRVALAEIDAELACEARALAPSQPRR